MSLSPLLSEFAQTRYARLIERCREASVAFHDDAGVAEHVQRVLLASDFAYESFQREPQLLGAGLIGLMSDPRHADTRALALPTDIDETGLMQALRRYRRTEALRLIWRDVNGLDTVEDTLAGASALAEACLAAALDYAERVFVERHGVARSETGVAQRLVVLGLGKLGGGELNFSSDIDLILAFSENGRSDGVRALENETYFARLGQLLVKLLAQITADGYVFRVDLRLRPFGSAGRVALSFAAMEQYYQSEGRDWERYAWIKARPVAGDIAAGKRLLEALRPFVYRRYRDYTAFAGLREMKALIDAEVARKDLAHDLKLGPGGIREIEFIVQLLQLIRGGREPGLRECGLLPALAACEQLGAMRATSARRLREAYRFLRRVENRVQMLRDEQTHELPPDAHSRERLAVALGYADWSALEAQVASVRAGVTEEFAGLWAPARAPQAGAGSDAAARAYWNSLQGADANAKDLQLLGFTATESLHAQLVALLANPATRELSDRARACLDRLMPLLIESAAASVAPDVCLERLLRLVHGVLRRSAYLTLLEEQPSARERLVALFADCALLADRVIRHPLLLDDIFEARLDAALPDRATFAAEIDRRMALIDDDDAEARIELLQEEKQSAAFRLGLACRSGHLDAVATARALSDAAEVLLQRALNLAWRDVARQHGRIGDGFAAIGYGSLGGAELGFASDLDLVFVYDGKLSQRESDGVRPLEGARYFARIAQRVVHWLTTQTHAGRLFDVDVRLRPDGGKGLLVISLDAFAEYQRERAWIWEQQAIVRARAIAGDAATMQQFAQLRTELLARQRDAGAVCAQVSTMRARWRTERDRSTSALLDLKQGAGALLDIEFILQTLVLLHAGTKPELIRSGNSAELIAAAGRCGALPADQARMLESAHRALLARALACTLDARPRLAPRVDELMAHTGAVLRMARGLGLDFESAAAG